MTALNKQAINFSQPLETESGEPVKYICHDVIEYKCARVCVDIATGVVYSSPYVGLKIRNKETTQRAKLREQIESAADAYRQFDNGWISDMKCGDLSHEYLLFVKEPKNVLALLDELEKEKGYASAYEGEKWHYHQLAESEGERANRAEAKLEAAEKRMADQQGIILSTRKFISEYAEMGDSGAAEFVKILDSAAGIGVNGE